MSDHPTVPKLKRKPFGLSTTPQLPIALSGLAQQIENALLDLEDLNIRRRNVVEDR